MGWCEGSHICEDVWLMVRDYVPEDERVDLLAKLIERFSDEDADCWGEVLYNIPEYHDALKKIDLYELYFEDEEE
ncbi:MAG: hypothetical protein HC836_25695 [Richelia sp. RM2_1_2]|nr:hypothetical protein [Richelia sp. RM2_1_2]